MRKPYTKRKAEPHRLDRIKKEMALPRVAKSVRDGVGSGVISRKKR